MTEPFMKIRSETLPQLASATRFESRSAFISDSDTTQGRGQP
jgi:hypothetical protein